MSILEYNEIRPRKYIVYEGDPFEVIDSHVFRKQQRKPVNATKLKNLITGKVMEISFHQSEKVAEAEISSKEAKYLYSSRGENWFCDDNNPKDRFMIGEETIGDKIKYLLPNSIVELLSFEGRPMGVKLPIKVRLKIKEAPPSIKGNTAQGGTKQVVLETGAVINAPLFVNEGDTIVINTDTGEYVERG